MSTRKLILWALVCGILILGASSVKLLQSTKDAPVAQLLALGESVTLGDMTVSVTAIRASNNITLVDVTMVGVAEAQAMDGWKLLAAGEVVDPVLLPIGDGTECTLTQLDSPLACTVAFAVSSESPTVAYVRAGEQRQWTSVP